MSDAQKIEALRDALNEILTLVEAGLPPRRRLRIVLIISSVLRQTR